MNLPQTSRNRRIGKWVWALSGEEGLTATLVERALRGGEPVSDRLMKRYAAMVEKQRKLVARQKPAAASLWAAAPWSGPAWESPPGVEPPREEPGAMGDGDDEL